MIGIMLEQNRLIKISETAITIKRPKAKSPKAIATPAHAECFVFFL